MLSNEIKQLSSNKFPFFSKLFHDEEKSKDITYKTITAGTYAFMEGEYYPFISLILSGTLRVSKIGENGREIILYRVNQGESCILLISSALSNQPYAAIAYVEEDVEIINIPITIYQQEIANVELVRTFTYQLYNKRIGGMMSLIEEIVFNKMDKRIAEFLIQHSNDDPTIEITHETLAIELRSAREVVSRVLKEFEKKGYVTLKRGKIVIHSRNDFILYAHSL